MIKEAITRVVENNDLSREESKEVMGELMTGQATNAQIGAFLTALRMKGETVDEITGMVEVMRENATGIKTSHVVVVDTCGTGGDGTHTFNISTVAAIVASGAGACVAKHGNRSVSSSCGSADVLNSLGVNLEVTPEKVGQCLDEIKIGFLFAPLLHGAMKHVIGPRREMGIRTAFNILGPMTNPAGAKRQVMGIFNPALIRPMAEVLKNLGSEHVLVFNGSGMDELTVLGESNIAELKDGEIKEYTITPEQFGLKTAEAAEITCKTVEDCTQAVREVLNGKAGAKRDISVLNAGAALYVGGLADSIAAGIGLAGEAIDSGKAKGTLEGLVEKTNE